jgi:hypothetical protein
VLATYDAVPIFAIGGKRLGKKGHQESAWRRPKAFRKVTGGIRPPTRRSLDGVMMAGNG